MTVQLEGLAAAAIARPAPGPVEGPAFSTMGAHYRDPADRRRCVCGVSWVQAMTCHPCRLGPHTARDCVDGPPGVQVPHRDGTPRLVYADHGAGRWCSCQHAAPDGEPLAHAWTPPAAAVGVTLNPAPDLYSPGTITVTIPADAPGVAEDLGSGFGHPAYTAPPAQVDEVPEGWRPRPFLAPAIAAVVGGAMPAAGFYRGLRASDIAGDRLGLDFGRELLARVTERQRQAIAERPVTGRPLAERLAAARAHAQAVGWAAEIEMPDGERVAARVFFGPAAREADAETAAARAARLLGARGRAMN